MCGIIIFGVFILSIGSIFDVVADVFHEWFAFLLWLNLISFIAFGGITGCIISTRFGVFDGKNFIGIDIGLVVGGLVGYCASILWSGLITVFLSANEKLEKRNKT